MVLKSKQLGLAFGCFLAIIHLVWALSIAIIKQPMQNFLNWIFEIHMIQPYWILTQFSLMNTIWLVIITFVFGYILGWLLAVLWNKFGVKK